MTSSFKSAFGQELPQQANSALESITEQINNFSQTGTIKFDELIKKVREFH
jgi:hypothetical protein